MGLQQANAAVQTSASDISDRIGRLLGMVRPEWLHRLRAGAAFMRGVYVGAVNFGHVQLINPAGATVTVLVYDVHAELNTNGRISFGTYNTQLPTNVIPANLLAGGAAAQGKVMTDDNAAELPAKITEFFTLASARAAVLPEGAWGFELPAGKGICVWGPAGLSITATYRWIEL
jgi:hypothetical protein